MYIYLCWPTSVDANKLRTSMRVGPHLYMTINCVYLYVLPHLYMTLNCIPICVGPQIQLTHAQLQAIAAQMQGKQPGQPIIIQTAVQQAAAPAAEPINTAAAAVAAQFSSTQVMAKCKCLPSIITQRMMI